MAAFSRQVARRATRRTDLRIYTKLLAAGTLLLLLPARANEALRLADVFAEQPSPAKHRPVVSFISPGHLFPVEGTTFLRRDVTGMAETYRPLAAYAEPHGAKVGDVHLANAHCVPDQNAAGCEAGYAWFLQTSAGTRYRLAVQEYSYETSALVTYRASVRDHDRIWSQIDFAAGSFWVVTGPAEVIKYEQVATLVEGFDHWCIKPGQCRALTREMADELHRMRQGAYKVASCYPQAYEIAGRVTVRGRRYYKVVLVEIEKGHPQPKLPKSGFVPVHNRDGSHTGTFYSRGC